MKEEPNLIYLNQLSDGDEVIKNRLLSVFKEEFVNEVQEYNINIMNCDFLSASENVHKLKHKIGFLGMEKAYDLANEYEKNLTDNFIILKDEFESILNVINEFILKN